MPSLGHSLSIKNSRNVERRQERARQVIHRLPVELAGCILGLRKQRLALEPLLSLAAASGDFEGAARISDSLAKVAETLNRLSRDNRSKPTKPKFDADAYYACVEVIDDSIASPAPEYEPVVPALQ